MKGTSYNISLCLIAGISLLIPSYSDAWGEEIWEFISKEATKSDLAMGKRIYSVSCILCHGSKGEGDGPASVSIGPYSHPRPNDFTRGSFKFRTTEPGDLPTLSDLMRTIRYGIPGYMPSFRHLEEEGIRQVALYIATKFIQEELPVQTIKEAVEETDSMPKNGVQGVPMSRTTETEIARLDLYKDIVMALNDIVKNSVIETSRTDPPEPIKAYSSTKAAISRGKSLFQRMQCIQCHGADGKGHMAMTNMKDERGLHIMAADLTKPETFGNGNTPEDIYRTIMTGLNGTPMPSYSDLFKGKEEGVWDLVAYIRSLQDE